MKKAAGDKKKKHLVIKGDGYKVQIKVDQKGIGPNGEVIDMKVE